MSERALEDFAQIASDWFWEMDAELRFTYFSNRAGDFGFAPDELIGRSRLESASNPDDAAFWQRHLDDVTARRPYRDFTYPFRAADGQVRWIRATGQPRFAPDGAFLGYRGVGADVTAERETDERLARVMTELRSANERFDAALNNMAQGLLMLDRDLRMIVCNSRCIEIMGLSPAQMQPGVSLLEIVEHRVAAGRHPGCTAEEVYAERVAIFVKGKPATLKTSYDNERTIQVAYRPMADGGWVLTYEDVTERESHLSILHKQEEELRVRNLQFDAALNNMAQGLMMLDPDLRLIVCNSRCREIMGLSSDAVRPGVTFRSIVERRIAAGRHPGRTADQVLADRMKIIARGEPAILKTLYDDRTIQVAYRPMSDGGWVLTYEDVTERESYLHTLYKQEEELRIQNLRFDAALNNMAHGLCMFDGERRLIVCNRRYAEMYGLSPKLTEPGASYEDILRHRIATGLYPKSGAPQYVADLTAALDEALPTNTLVELPDGRVLSIAYQPMPKGGWLAVHEDVTERKRAEARIEHMARHDALTDLANRRLFREQTETALARVRRHGSFGILCVDLDHFKAVNDTLGHPAGDALLCQVGERLRSCVRDGDTVARLGGDEFAMLQLGIGRPEEASGLGRRVIEALSEPYDIAGQQVVIGASIGIAVGPGDGTDPDQLLKHADMALYRAKTDGRGTFRFFEPEMDARLRARRALELDLRKALAQDEFEVFYQPLVDLRSNRVSGCEALLRWHHPTRGLVSPTEFIGLAEEIGLIVPLGEWVLRQACQEAAHWPNDIKVAVNLSPAQFKSRNLVQAVIRALASSGISATRLELEITESVLLLENEATLATLYQLRGLGVRISMDDFGTGYSSLSYLRSFPFDKIKIDRSFVRDLAEKPDAAAIIRAVVGLGASLGMTTTAEGVETMEQLEQVRAEGCTEVQGYLFSRPRRVDDLASMFADISAASVAPARTAA